MGEKKCRLLILGSGPAGYTAAIYAARANLSPVLVTGMLMGGQLSTTTLVENWPGEPQGIDGPLLMEKMREQVKNLGAEFITDEITSCDLKERPFFLKGHERSYLSDALIIATGASPKKLGLSGENTYLGRGVSTCATCDGFFYRGEEVAVVGGGNTAAEEALYLASIAKKVYLIHRRDQLRAEAALVHRLFTREKEKKIEFVWNAVVQDIQGNESGVTSLLLASVSEGKTFSLPVKGVFIAIGHSPNTAIFDGQMQMDSGYIVTRCGRQGLVTATSVPGVFAAGDVQDRIYRQAVTSAGSGCMAAMDALHFLEETGG